MVISNVNDFAKIWAMTEGGPGYATTTLVVYVYRLAFGDFNFGYASAIGVVWLVLLLIFCGALPAGYPQCHEAHRAMRA